MKHWNIERNNMFYKINGCGTEGMLDGIDQGALYLLCKELTDHLTQDQKERVRSKVNAD